MFKTPNDEDLNTHYQNQQRNNSFNHPCDNSTDTRRLCFSPYDGRETWNYILRMVVLPGIIPIILIALMISRYYENYILGTISVILSYVGFVLIYTYIREKRRENRFKIPQNQLLTQGSLNQIAETKFRIGFVGDIMRMREKPLNFSTDVKKFFEDANIIVGNLEGIVINQKCPLSKQRHLDTILGQLQNLLQGNTSWLLCLSNNHSIDFGNSEFHNSLHRIRITQDIDVFGRNEVPNVFVTGVDISIASASEWSNQKNWNCITRYNSSNLPLYHSNHTNNTKFNILFPHWGYENERYVRDDLRDRAINLLTTGNDRWDLIFGHHPHVRQPIMEVEDTNGIKKFVAFSGGNFTSGVRLIRRRKHIHGIILKCDIGPLENNNNHLAVGNVEWKNTVCIEDGSIFSSNKIVKLDTGHDPQTKLIYLILGILIVIGIIILSVLEILY